MPREFRRNATGVFRKCRGNFSSITRHLKKNEEGKKEMAGFAGRSGGSSPVSCLSFSAATTA